MINSVDYTIPLNLEGFTWSNLLRKLYGVKKGSACTNFYNIYLDSEEYLVYLTIIWDRLREDYVNFNKYCDFHDKMFDKAKNLANEAVYRLSPEEIQESSNLRPS